MLRIACTALVPILFAATVTRSSEPGEAKGPLAATGPVRLVRTFEGHTVQIPSVAFLPDGRRVMSCSYDGTRVWDIESGTLDLNVRPGGLAAVSPDGTKVAIRSGAAIRLHSIDDGRVLYPLDPQLDDVSSAMDFSRDGQWLATGGEAGIVRIWNATTGKRFRELKGHTKAVRAVKFSADGKRLLSGGVDKTIRVWNVESGKEERQFPDIKYDVLSLDVSPDGRFVLWSGFVTNIAICEFQTGVMLRRLTGSIAGVYRARFTPDGHRVVCGSADKTVRIWSAQTGRQLAVLEGHRDYVLDVDVSPDGRFAASVSGGDNEDGKWIGGDDHTVRVWRLPAVPKPAVPQSVELRLTGFEGGPPGEYSRFGGTQSDVLGLGMSGDGQSVATAEKDGSVRLWNLSTNRVIGRLPRQDTMVRAVAYSDDGRRIVTGTHGRQLRIWEVASKQPIADCPRVTAQVLCAEFASDDTVVFGVHGGVDVWNTRTNNVTRLAAPSIHPHDIAVSRRANAIAAASHDSRVRVWDLTSLKPRHELIGHTDEVVGVDFDPSGETLVSSSRDRTVRLWDLETGKVIRTFTGHTNSVESVRFLSDGRRVISGGTWQDGTIRLWDALSGQQLWSHGNEAKITRAIRVTPDARFAVAANSHIVSVLRLPELQNTSAIEAYELARRNEGPEQRIAVLGFVDQGPSVELAPLRTAIAELLTARIGQYRRVHAVERLQVEQFLRESKLTASGVVDAATAAKAGQVLTADYLLAGTFSGDAGRISISATLTKVGANDPLAQWTVAGKASDLFDIERRLATRTLESLGIKKPQLSTTPPAQLGKSPRIAVLAFRNLGHVPSVKPAEDRVISAASLESLQGGLGEFLQATLSAIPDVQLVEREDLESILAEQKLTLAGLTDPATAARIGKIAGAERFIYGSFLESGGKITVVARLADTETTAVLGTEVADGTAADIGDMLRQLALRLAARLHARQPKDAAQVVERAIPVRKLEAAVYLARAKSLQLKGNLDGAFEDYDRALLIEPDNLEIRLQYIRALSRLGDVDRLIEVGEETLALKTLAGNMHKRGTVYSYLLSSLRYAGRHEERVEVARRYAKEFPGDDFRQRRARAAEARSLRGSNRRREAIALLEAEVMKAEANGNVEAYGNSLAQLFYFYDSELSFYSGGSRVPKITEESARRAAETAELLLELCEDRRGRSAAYWGRVIVPRAVTLLYYREGERGSKYYLDVPDRINFLNRARATFHWNAEIKSRAAFELAKQSIPAEQYEQTAAAFREFLSLGYYKPGGVISSHDRDYIQPNSWIDHQIEAQYRLAHILHRNLNRPEEALTEYQKFVENYGLANFHGSHVTAGLTELGAEPEFPERAVLLWGGNTESFKSWTNVLQPLGFTTHMARRYHFSASDLAPYELVILLRSGDLPLNPVDILGMRSYVATGGALAVVVSPAYEAAAPGIHDALLSIFGVRPGVVGIDRATATHIDGDHPITRRIPAATARHAVALDCPPAASLIESNGKTLLAAIPYRGGRIVVSSFAQWLLPDPTVFGAQWQRHLSRRYGSSRPLNSIPVERFSGTHAALVKQTIDWLTPGFDGERSQPRASFQPAWQAARQFEGRALPRSRMTAAFDRLIDQTTGMWKEEALWLAGEAHLRRYYFANKSLLNWSSFGTHYDDRPFAPRPEYFVRLTEQFPDSPLTGLAQWRRAECERQMLMRGRGSSHDSLSTEDAAKLISLYKEVGFQNGSLAWLWSQWRIGRMHYYAGDAQKAVEHFRRVSESVPAGTVKVMALLDLAKCLRLLGEDEVAKKAVDAVMAQPNYEWWDRAYERYCPLVTRIGNSKYMATKVLGD